MIRGQPFQQRDLLLRLGVLGPGDELGVQHLALTHLVLQRQAWMGQHVSQTLQSPGKQCNWQLKEKFRGALTGTGIDLAAMTLHVGHQPFVRGKTLGAEEQQMFQEMRQPRPRQRHIMAACRYAQNGGAAFQTWRMLQGNPQAIGKGQVKVLRVGRRRHGQFRNVGSAYANKPAGSGLVQHTV